MHLACVLATALTIVSFDLPPSQQGTTTPSDSAAQVPAPTENTQTPPANQSQPAAQTEASKAAPAKKGPAKRNIRKRRVHKPPTAAGEPHKIVVHQGGASEPVAQIMPGMTQEQANRQRQNAEQLLASTEVNLSQLAARTLTSIQQDTVAQIHHYLDGAQSALKDGDTQRAHTLAQKAYLLSHDLVKH